MGKSKRNNLPVKQDLENMDQVQVISSDDKKFAMNSEALKSHSEYFRGLLDSGMVESQNRTVHLPTLPAESIRYVDAFLKNGDVSIEEYDYDALSNAAYAASYLLMTGLMNIVTDLIMEWLTIDNFDDSVEFANQFALLDAREKMEEWVLENGSDYIRSNSFYKRSYEEARTILSSDNLLVDDEIEVAEAGIKWMDKQSLCTEELCEVRPLLMDFTALGSCLRKARPKVHRKLLQIIKEPSTFNDKAPEAFYNAQKDVKIRCEDSYLVSVGGFAGAKTNHGSKQLQIVPVSDLNVSKDLDLKFQTCDKEKLQKNACEHCVCILRNDIYVIGGQTRYRNDGRYTTNEAYRFNTCIRKWQKLASMREPRSLFYCGVVAERIYAISGWIKPHTVTKTIEEYSPETNTWKYMHCIERGVHEHAGSVINDKIYISGGYKGPELGHLDTVRMFDPLIPEHDLGRWVNLAPMQVARSYHVMAAVGNKGLIVAGGVQYHGNTDSMEDIQQCEYYDVESDQWTLLDNPLPYTGSCMGHVLHDKNLFLFGGHLFADDIEEKTHEKLQILDTETFEWTVASYTSSNVCLFPCVIVNLPRNFTWRFRPVEKLANKSVTKNTKAK